VITSIDHQVSKKGNTYSLELILGDEMGYLRFLNLNEVFTECQIKPFFP